MYSGSPPASALAAQHISNWPPRFAGLTENPKRKMGPHNIKMRSVSSPTRLKQVNSPEHNQTQRARGSADDWQQLGTEDQENYADNKV